MWFIFYSKKLKTEAKFRTSKKETEKDFFVSEVIASENVAINSLF